MGPGVWRISRALGLEECPVKSCAHTFVPAFNIDPRVRIPMIISLRHNGKLRGSLGSSLGCGDNTMCEFFPVPCFKLPVSDVWSCGAALSSRRTVPGTSFTPRLSEQRN